MLLKHLITVTSQLCFVTYQLYNLLLMFTLTHTSFVTSNNYWNTTTLSTGGVCSSINAK